MECTCHVGFNHFFAGAGEDHAGDLVYYQSRGLGETSLRRVWGVFGDVEMDEPESRAALSLARAGRVPAIKVARAIEQYGVHTDGGPPWQQ